MGLPKGPEGQGLPEVRTSVPDTLGLLGREGQARGGGQGLAWGWQGHCMRLLRCECPKAGPGYPGGTADGSSGVLMCRVLLGANLRITGVPGDRGNIQSQPHSSRGLQEFLSRTVWKPPHVARLAPPGQGCCAQESQQSRGERWDCPGSRCAEGGDLGTQSPAGVRVASFSFPFVGKKRHLLSLSPLAPGPGRMEEVWELCLCRGGNRVEDTLSRGALCWDRHTAACTQEGRAFQEWL